MLDMVILGLVQGLKEFLPVSSTAHLIFAEAFLGISRPGILLEAVLHLITAITAGIWTGLRKEEAARLSFLAAVTASSGVNRCCGCVGGAASALPFLVCYNIAI